MEGNLRQARMVVARPPTPSPISLSKNRESKSKRSLTNQLSLWLTIFLLWCDPITFANALPHRTRISPDIISDSEDYFFSLEQDKPNSAAPLLVALPQKVGDEDEDEVQEEQRVVTDSGEQGIALIRPRRKKGLSFLTKFYSEAILNNSHSSSNNNGSGNTFHRQSPHFFGVSGSTNKGNVDTASSSSSTEDRFGFPMSSIRRKLSFYPPSPLMSHSVLMTPWGRVPSARQTKMRLRWGK